MFTLLTSKLPDLSTFIQSHMWFIGFLILILFYLALSTYGKNTYLFSLWLQVVDYFIFYFGSVHGRNVAIFFVSCVWGFFFYWVLEPLILYIVVPQITEITDLQHLDLIKQHLIKTTDTDKYNLGLRRELLSAIRENGKLSTEDLRTLRDFVCWTEGPKSPRFKKPFDLSSWRNY